MGGKAGRVSEGQQQDSRRRYLQYCSLCGQPGALEKCRPSVTTISRPDRLGGPCPMTHRFLEGVLPNKAGRRASMLRVSYVVIRRILRHIQMYKGRAFRASIHLSLIFIHSISQVCCIPPLAQAVSELVAASPNAH